MAKVKYIVWHTAAHGENGRDYDTSASQIDAWHKARGWSGIGYHFVIRKDGRIEAGRKLNDDDVLSRDEVGAHVYGINNESVGICFSGHGDIAPHTGEQRQAGIILTAKLMKQFGITSVDNVIGHREINKLVDKGLYPTSYRTTKTCPGKLVDMDEVRQQIKDFLQQEGKTVKPSPEDAKALFEIFKSLYSIASKLKLSNEVISLINGLRKHPEIDKVISAQTKL